MKKILAICLVLAMLVPLCLTNLTVQAEKTAVKPFYGVTWGGVDTDRFDNLAGMPSMYFYIDSKGEPYFIYGNKNSSIHGMSSIAMEVKKEMASREEGLRYMQMLHPIDAFGNNVEDTIFLDAGVAQAKALVVEFFAEYKALGGKLDGLIMDLEYQNVLNWWIYQRYYVEADYKDVYKDIVENPRYQTEIRPLLEERGFKFYTGSGKPEIYSIYPYSGDQYEESRQIWDNVMRIRLAEYLNDSFWEPLQTYYPGTHMSDYQTTDGYGWQKKLDRTGANFYLGGNIIKAGDTSNLNAYMAQPVKDFYVSGSSNRYITPVSYNEAVYDADSYAMFLWDMNRFKQMYEATDNGQVNFWIAEYDTFLDAYTGRESNSGDGPYYSEMLLHMGLMDPDVFLLFMPRETRNDPENEEYILTDEEFNMRYQVVADCLTELTRVVGAEDREPIYVPYSWNDGYVLSGMYAGGRNMWRITPDTTDGMTVEEFLVNDQAPTFRINGKTIIFPQGRIVETGEIAVLGSGGYWVETPADVKPVVITDADRYAQNPSYEENFERYSASTSFPANAKEEDAWSKGLLQSNATVVADGNNKVLSMTGNMTITNSKLPGNITAGDDYAKEQAWEISFTLPSTLSNGEVKLLTYGNNDTGFKISGRTLYYANGSSSVAFSGLTLETNTKYTLVRQMNFNNFTCTYLVYANGSLIAKAENIAISSATLPITEISISTKNLNSQKVYVDDYKLYPMGFTAGFEVYNANTGIKLSDATVANNGDVAYRLSWLNATATAKKATVVAQYYKNGVLNSTETVGQFVMAPGNDGVESAIVKNKDGMTVKLVMQTSDTTLAATPDYSDGDFDWPRYEDNVVQPEDTITSRTPVIYMENGRAVVGQEFKVTVSLKNNPGVAYAKLNVSYDTDKLQLVSVQDAGLLKNFSGSAVTDFPYVMTWGDTANLANVTDNGAIAVLTFKVLADDACETDISISFARRFVYNADGKVVEFIPVRNTVSIQNHLPGDVNGDGKVNGKDATQLARYVAGWEGVDVDLAAADVNADGKVNGKDATQLARYVAGWENIELK